MAQNYTVTGQRPSSHVTPGGQIENTYVVTFTTKPGNIAGQVEIPVGQYTPDKVHQLVDAQAVNLEAIAAL